MLLPEKHITLAESILGLGALLLEMLDRPRTLDYLFKQVRNMREKEEINAFHDFDSITLAVLFLHATGVVEGTETGAIRRCAS
jgi:hypothetical protein